jgi:hypothetical protein
VLVGLCGYDEAMESLRQVRMGACSGDQVWLKPDVVEDRISGKCRCDGRVRRGRRVDAHQSLRHLGGKRRVGIAIAQLRLPQRVPIRGQKLHGERSAGFVDTQQPWRRARDGSVGMPHPARLVAVALNRRLPIRRYAQLCQRALDADRAGSEVDPPDVG